MKTAEAPRLSEHPCTDSVTSCTVEVVKLYAACCTLLASIRFPEEHERSVGPHAAAVAPTAKQKCSAPSPLMTKMLVVGATVIGAVLAGSDRAMDRETGCTGGETSTVRYLGMLATVPAQPTATKNMVDCDDDEGATVAALPVAQVHVGMVPAQLRHTCCPAVVVRIVRVLVLVTVMLFWTIGWSAVVPW